MGSSCCTGAGGAKVTTLEADAPKAEEDAARQEAEAVADAFEGLASSHDESYVVEKHAPEAEIFPMEKPAAPALPSATPAPSSEGPAQIAFTLQWPMEENLGLNIDAADETAPFVDEVLAGSIADWNKANPEEKQLRMYDRILEVNGVKGNTDSIVASLKQSVTWNLVLQRPCQMIVTITSDKSVSLGLDLKYSPQGQSLLIGEVLVDGSIHRWNEEHPDKPVKVLDRVIQINGKMGPAKELLASVADKASLELVVLSYPA